MRRVHQGFPGTTRVRCIAFACLLGLAGESFAQAGGAKLYRYVDQNGRVHYTEQLPIEALKVDELNRQGVVVKQLEGTLTPQQRAERDAEARRKLQEEARQREQKRTDTMLLSSYSHVRDINAARDFALAAAEDSIKRAEARISDLTPRLQKAKADAARYSPENLPPELAQELAAYELDLSNQRGIVDKNRKELVAISARFDAEKRRYDELTGGQDKKPGPAPSAEQNRATPEQKPEKKQATPGNDAGPVRGQRPEPASR